MRICKAVFHPADGRIVPYLAFLLTQSSVHKAALAVRHYQEKILVFFTPLIQQRNLSISTATVLINQALLKFSVDIGHLFFINNPLPHKKCSEFIHYILLFIPEFCLWGFIMVNVVLLFFSGQIISLLLV